MTSMRAMLPFHLRVRTMSCSGGRDPPSASSSASASRKGFHRLDRVEQEIEDRLLHEALVEAHDRERPVGVEGQVHARAGALGHHEGRHVLEHPVEVDLREVQAPDAGVAQEVVEDLLEALAPRRSRDLRRRAVRAYVRGSSLEVVGESSAKVLLEELQGHVHGRERVADLVHEAAGHRTEELEPLRTWAQVWCSRPC